MDKRLVILNTVVSYSRSLLTVGLSLFTTRWILAALGKADLGLFYAVGGIVVFLSFINTSMSFSSQRHFAYALGRGGQNEVKDWFNSSLSLHAMLAAAFLILSIPLGIIAFKWWLVVPTTRISTCHLVYACAVITAVGSMLTVPFNAIYIARQRIYELTFIQLFQSILMFVLAYWLLSASGDRLKVYSVGMASISLMVYLAQIVRCRMVFDECRISFQRMLSRQRYKELLSFSGWSLTSTFAYIFRGQGIALLLNNFGTSGVNAAYGIANQVSGQAGFLANGLMTAVAPEMTKMEGAGNHEEMVKLATRACKFVTLLVMFLLIPLFTDIEPLLHLWLKEVPENTASFVRIMLLAFLSIQMVLGVTVAIKAVGKIAWPEVFSSIALILAVPLAYGAIRVNLPIVCVVVTFAVTAALCALSTLLCAHNIFGYSIRAWTLDVLCRNGLSAMICVLLNTLVHRFVPTGLLRLVIAGVLDATLLCVLGWTIVLSIDERKFLKSKVNVLKKRIYG